MSLQVPSCRASFLLLCWGKKDFHLSFPAPSSPRVFANPPSPPPPAPQAFITESVFRNICPFQQVPSSAQGLRLHTQFVVPGHGLGCPSSRSLLCKVVPEADNRGTLL